MTAADPKLHALLRAVAAEAVRGGDDPLEVIDAAIGEAVELSLAALRGQISTEMRGVRAAVAADAHALLRSLVRTDPPGVGSFEARRALLSRRLARLADVAAQVQTEG